jgi:outer membrane protein TolC
MRKTFMCHVLAIVFGMSSMIIPGDTVAASAGSGGSSESAPSAEALSIEKAFELALANQPDLKVSEAEKSAAQQDVKKARGRLLPSVNFREAFIRSDNPVQVFSDKLAQQNFQAMDFGIKRLNYPTLHNNLRSQIILTQPIFNKGAFFADYKNATYYEQMSRASESQTRQKVLLDVETAYLGWLLAIDTHTVMLQTVETAEADLKITGSRFQEGMVLKSDVLQSEVNLASLRKEALGTNNNIAIARSQLNVAMGIDPEREWRAVFPDSARSDETKDLAYWSQKALDNRPERAYTDLLLKITRMTVKKHKMNFLPALHFNGVYEYASEGTRGASGDNLTVMLTADFNIFNGLSDCAEYKKARAEELRALAVEREVEQNIRNDVHTSWLNLMTAREQVAVTRNAVAQAEEGLRIVQERYQSGLTIITELLNSETALHRARLEHLRARYDGRLAHAELRWAAGILDAGERSL